MPESDRPLYSHEIVEQHFPLDGPYDSSTTIRAVWTIDATVRYLNYATASTDGLPTPADVYELAGGLKTAMERLPQTLRQAEQRLAALAKMPELVNVTMPFWQDPDPSHADAVARAARARVVLQRAAALAAEMKAALTDVHNVLASVGMNLPDTDDED